MQERFYDLDKLGSQMEYHLSHYTPHSLQTLSNDVTAVVDEIRTSQVSTNAIYKRYGFVAFCDL